MAAWIKRARTHAGLTQEDLGALVGVSKSNANAWEKGLHSPSVDQWLTLAEKTKYPALPPTPGWPFKTIERSRYELLDDDKKAQIEGRLHSAISACEIADQTPELSRRLVELLTYLDSITSPLDRLIAVETALAALGQGKREFEPKQAPAKALRKRAASTPR